jgi:GT2 family glycosyltransferase
MNVAASTARGSHLILLNPDTVVLEGALDQFLFFARNHPGHGLYAGRTVNADGRTDPRSCWGAPSLWSLTCFGLGLSTIFSSSPLFNPESLGRWGRDSVREVGVVSGCLCLVPRSVWCQLGGFNPVYFMYGEDADLAMRAAKHGYRPIFTPDATIVHEVGASSATDLDKTLLLMRGKATLVRQQWSGRALNWALAMLWLGVWLRAVLTATRRKRHDTIWPQVRSRTSDWIAGYEGKQS